ncbi:MAG TPA: ABC transporter permease [Rhizomicrobium sp.]|jgi:putative ABC transport system permease protein
MDFLRQIATAIRLGLSSLPARFGTSLVIVIGMACAVGALVSVLSLSTGFLKAATGAGRTDRAIILSQGAISENGSSLSRAEIAAITGTPDIRKGPSGRQLASADMLGTVLLTKKTDGFSAFVPVRGVGPDFFALHPEIRVLHGRKFQPGKYEVLVGEAAQTAFAGQTEGSRIDLPQGRWIVTGTFKSTTGAGESQMLTDAPTLMAAMRSRAYKSMTIQLASADRFAAFKNALTSNPALSVDVSRETDYLARQARMLNNALMIVGYLVGGIMGLGAMFGALNTMYSAVSARRIEIATLRAIGFGGGAVIWSVLAESLLLAFLGASIGAAIAWALFNNNLQVLSGTVIHLAVTPGLAVGGIVFACLLGLIGGFFPAIRAARRPIAEALRAT